MAKRGNDFAVDKDDAVRMSVSQRHCVERNYSSELSIHIKKALSTYWTDKNVEEGRKQGVNKTSRSVPAEFMPPS
jgi:hypothetical protein